MSTLYHELTDRQLTDAEVSSLLDYASDVEDQKDIHRDPDGFTDNDGNTSYEFSDFQFCIVDNSVNNDVITKIRNFLPSNRHVENMMFVWINDAFDYHKEIRKCCLIVPLLETPSPLKFVNSNDFSEELGSYTFTKGLPVLIDTQYTHLGNRDNTTPQQFFELSFSHDYSTVSSWYNE